MDVFQQPSNLDALVRELDVLIRARYPLIAVNTFEEMRLRRLIDVVANLERHRTKGLSVWSHTHRLRQVAGPGLGPYDRAIPDTEDPHSVLEHIDQAERGLFVLCDYAPYLAPFGQEEPQLVRRLRELAWAIKTRPVTVLLVGPGFPAIPALEKEVKQIELPLPDEREVSALLGLRLAQLADNPDVRLAVDERTKEQLVQALLGLTETEVENALAKAAITHRRIGPAPLPLILDEKRSVIRQRRFGQVVVVDLPTLENRAAILRVHLTKRGRDAQDFDLEQLAQASEGFSGAEIEAAVKAALLDAFMDAGREVTTGDVLNRVRSIRPTSEVKREEIEEPRKWAREHPAIDAVRSEPMGGERRLEF